MAVSTRSAQRILASVVLAVSLSAGSSGVAHALSCGVPGGNECNMAGTVCTFQGLTNTREGAATLSIDGLGRLLISNIGSTGLDGVLVDNPSNLERSHEEWIELGVAAWLPPAVASTGVNSSIRVESTAVLSNSGADQTITLLMDEFPENTIRILATNPVVPTFAYEVYDQNGALLGSSASTNQAATANLWPSEQGFSYVRWASNATVTLPGGGTFPLARELQIVPSPPTSVTVTTTKRMKVTIKYTAPPMLGPGLSTLTVTEERFSEVTPCVSSGRAPALSGAAQVGLALALMSALALVLLWGRRSL